MAAGRDNQLTRQIGEHLVAAELGRRKYAATPFSGNVPMFDLLVADEAGHAIPIQVKAIRGASWQFTADRFLQVEIKDGEQFVRGASKLTNPDLVCIFVLVGNQLGEDRFYIFQSRDLQKHFLQHYRGGRRPKNPNSLHCAVWPDHLKKFEGNWKLLDRVFAKRASGKRRASPLECPDKNSLPGPTSRYLVDRCV
jgi:hypothetical protein